MFYNATKRHCHDVYLSWFPQGPHEVLLGRVEIQDCLGDCDWIFDDRNTPGRKLGRILSILMDRIPSLRNTVCHFGWRQRYWSANDYDKYLKDVQHLAVELFDEDGAVKAKQLRQELIEDAKTETRDLETRSLLYMHSQMTCRFCRTMKHPFSKCWIDHI